MTCRCLSYFSIPLETPWPWQLTGGTFFGGLTVSENESITIVTGSMREGRQAWAEAVSETLHLETPTERAERAIWEWCGLLKPGSLLPVTRPYLIRPKTVPSEPNIQIYEPVRAILS